MSNLKQSAFAAIRANRNRLKSVLSRKSATPVGPNQRILGSRGRRKARRSGRLKRFAQRLNRF